MFTSFKNIDAISSFDLCERFLKNNFFRLENDMNNRFEYYGIATVYLKNV